MSWLQKLVNAQVEINRAVFEANRQRPRLDYIRDRIAEAQADLKDARRGIRPTST